MASVGVVILHKITKCLQAFIKIIFRSAKTYSMMTPSNGNIFRVTDTLWRESTGEGNPPVTTHTHTKATNAQLWCFLWCAPEEMASKKPRCRWYETLWCSLWRHCNAKNLIAKWTLKNIRSYTTHLYCWWPSAVKHLQKLWWPYLTYVMECQLKG